MENAYTQYVQQLSLCTEADDNDGQQLQFRGKGMILAEHGYLLPATLAVPALHPMTGGV